MSAQEPLLTQHDGQKEVLGKIDEITRIAAGGNYIFRGEPEHYDKVSSGLYRRERGKGVEDFNALQREELSRASEFDGEPNELEALTIIQHHGGKTNVIDFTRDSYVALYFACEKSHGEDGRVVCYRQADDTSTPILEPLQSDNRVIAQKSVFVQPKKGFIEPHHLVNIPSALKGPILGYLQRERNISEVSLYNDLYGFIRSQNPVGDNPLQPSRLAPEQEALCRRLDELYQPYNLNVRPSDLFRGAVFAIREECRSNPDRIAQAAHSLREILYPIWSPKYKEIADNKKTVFKNYGSVSIEDRLITAVGNVYGRLTKLAHHDRTASISSDFEQLLAEFERSMGLVLTRQLDLHKEIDELVSSGPPQ